MMGIIIHPPLMSKLRNFIQVSSLCDSLTIEVKVYGDIDPFRDGDVPIFGWFEDPAFHGVLCRLIQCGMSTAFTN